MLHGWRMGFGRSRLESHSSADTCMVCPVESMGEKRRTGPLECESSVRRSPHGTQQQRINHA